MHIHRLQQPATEASEWSTAAQEEPGGKPADVADRLRPLCPNCHAAIHLAPEHVTVESMRRAIMGSSA